MKFAGQFSIICKFKCKLTEWIFIKKKEQEKIEPLRKTINFIIWVSKT
jgi:hypothetical protein